MPATIKVSAPSARSCQGTMGDFSVSVVRSEAATYQLRLAVINSTPGDLAAVTLVNRNTGTYRNLINGTVLQNNQETVVGSISQSELDTYDTLTVTPFFQNGTWSNQVADRSTDC
ncbi:hypothetical protein EB093_09930 [bacterium]|nr:hypothetical protein [bacterium]